MANSANKGPAIISVALEIARERDTLLGHISDALKKGKDAEAIALMRKYCGIGNEESHRVNSSIH